MYLEMKSGVIIIIGIGNTGINAVKRMQKSSIEGVDFISTHTYTVQQLNDISCAKLVFLIADIHDDASAKAMILLAKHTKKLHILTLSIVTTPPDSASLQKKSMAEDTMLELEKHVDSNIIIPNSLLLSTENSTKEQRGKVENMAVLNTIQAMTDLIVQQGVIGFDFADFKTVTYQMQRGITCAGIASGEDRAKEATTKAISCFMQAGINAQNMQGILVNITAADMGIAEFDAVGNLVHDFVPEKTVIKIGMTLDESLGHKIKVTIVATGINYTPHQHAKVTTVATGINHAPHQHAIEDYLDIPEFLKPN